MSQIVFNSPESESEQVENLQTTLASLNQVVYSLQEALQERDQKIADLQTKLTTKDTSEMSFGSSEVKKDETLTVVGLLINLYQLVFPRRKVI